MSVTLSSYEPKKKVIVFTLILSAIIVLSLYFTIKFQNQTNVTKNITTVPNYTTVISTPTQKPTPTIIPIESLNFSNTPVPRIQFNLSEWETYENKEVGFRFKYPKKWGAPETYLGPGEDSTDGNASLKFSLIFPDSGSHFSVFGKSRNWFLGSECPPMYCFSSFDKDTGNTPERYCDKSTFLFCKNNNERVHFLSGWYFDFVRSLLINMPKSKLGGLAFGGSVLSKDSNIERLVAQIREQYHRAYPDNFERNDILDKIEQDLLERKVDFETMNNFDTFEKVFETVEIF